MSERDQPQENEHPHRPSATPPMGSFVDRLAVVCAVRQDRCDGISNLL